MVLQSKQSKSVSWKTVLFSASKMVLVDRAIFIQPTALLNCGYVLITTELWQSWERQGINQLPCKQRQSESITNRLTASHAKLTIKIIYPSDCTLSNSNSPFSLVRRFRRREDHYLSSSSHDTSALNALANMPHDKEGKRNQMEKKHHLLF